MTESKRNKADILTDAMFRDPFRVLRIEELVQIPENELRSMFERFIRQAEMVSPPANEAGWRAQATIGHNVALIYRVLRDKGSKVR